MNEIICGDALVSLKKLESGIVQTCITSPPYYSLRDYNVEGQIGLEETPELYISRLVEVFREVRRVLRDDGTLWVNIGDSYAGSGKGGQSEEKRSENWQPTYSNKGLTPRGYKPKDLIGIPWMLAFALRADGWYLRSDIIWSKPNCMPESVTDRPTKAHEYIFLLSKNERYYYDADAIREPHTRLWDERNGGNITEAAGHKKHFFIADRETPKPYPMPNELGRNKRSVWTVSTRAYDQAHFATFPPKLIEPCILAGTSPRACEHCGAPWERVTERIDQGWDGSRYGERVIQATGGLREDTEAMYRKSTLGSSHGKLVGKAHTTGWQPTCTCPNNTGSGSCVVLDPFLGSGTVAMMAIKHGRDYIGIELNPEYISLAEKRIAFTQQDLWTTAGEIAV